MRPWKSSAQQLARPGRRACKYPLRKRTRTKVEYPAGKLTA
jgi:hypothetical protein